jgi:hypothetical protein
MTYRDKSSLQKCNRTLLMALVFTSLFASCGSPEPRATTQSYALQHFSQDITSSTDHLTLSVNQTVKVPVTIKNTSSDTWFASYKFPINISFKWFSGGQILPIEGNRTALPKPRVGPNESISQDVVVVAPGTPGNYDLQITLVQEGVAWFNLAGAKPLVIPTVVR